MNDRKSKILGISAFYHDSAAALVVDGEIFAAAHEERFTRKKHDESFPKEAISYVLNEYGISISDLDAIVFYDKPYLKFERLLETYHAFAPKGVVSFFTSMPIWLKEKLFMRSVLWEGIEKVNGGKLKNRPKLLFSEHHLSHAASAFYPSPFEKAAILTIDGVGEWATTTIGIGDGKNIKIIEEMHFPHSLGLLYSAFTYYCGFKVNSGEYKLMGLAPYGNHNSSRVENYKKIILDNLIDLKEDGSLFLKMEYFNFATGLRMCDDRKWENIFGIPPRKPEGEMSQEYMDLALAIQEVTEDVVVKLARTARKITGMNNLVLAGGVALNCVANSKILDKNIFDSIWIEPAAGDAGGALGAALAGYYLSLGKERKVLRPDSIKGSYLGPKYSNEEILRTLRKYEVVFDIYENFQTLCDNVSDYISDGKVVGWFQGRMEWGPRALGNRSILGDPRNPEMQKKLNLKIKYREGFRPFAPSVLEEDSHLYFETNNPSPYMLFTAPVVKNRRLPNLGIDKGMMERLYSPRSDIPSVTHMDYSARLQTVSKDTNERFWSLIDTFKKKTGYGLLINTSFNVRNEPIVCSPEDALRCFMNTEMDYLVMGDFVLNKKSQPEFKEGTFKIVENEND